MSPPAVVTGTRPPALALGTQVRAALESSSWNAGRAYTEAPQEIQHSPDEPQVWPGRGLVPLQAAALPVDAWHTSCSGLPEASTETEAISVEAPEAVVHAVYSPPGGGCGGGLDGGGAGGGEVGAGGRG